MIHDGQAILTDFGGAVHKTWKRSSRELQSREYRSPEMILRYPLWDERIDVWSLGCLVYEVATQKVLFPPKWIAKKEKLSKREKRKEKKLSIN